MTAQPIDPTDLTSQQQPLLEVVNPRVEVPGNRYATLPGVLAWLEETRPTPLGCAWVGEVEAPGWWHVWIATPDGAPGSGLENLRVSTRGIQIRFSNGWVHRADCIAAVLAHPGSIGWPVEAILRIVTRLSAQPPF